MDTDDAVTIPLHNGRSLVLLPDALLLRDETGAEVRRIVIDEISGISRGGRDLTIIRREADPVAVTAMTVADGSRFLDTLRQQVIPTRPRWWQRHRMPRSGR